jgi:hypothetical protein
MILVALFVMIGGVSLVVFGLWWLLRVFPRVAATLRLSETELVALVAVLMLLAFSTYAGWGVECPFCHAGHVDAQGRCGLVQQRLHCGNYYTHPQWQQMSEKERGEWTGDPGHYRAETCPWCGHTGKMSRIAIWLD